MPVTVPDLPPLLDAFYGRATHFAITPLQGEVSTRRYYRVAPAQAEASGPSSLIVMQLPDDGPDGPSRIQARAFVDVQRFLATQSLPVPRIYAEDIVHGLLLLEDLGNETFEARLRSVAPQAWSGLYGQAIDLLARLHKLAEPPRDPTECIAFRKRYEAALLRSELEHFTEWGLEAQHGPLSAADRAELASHFDALTTAIVALPVGLVHRDYQSRNLMWAAGQQLTIIDFQDAFMGPAPYDLVALLCDSYVAISSELQAEMLARYAEQRGFTAEQAARSQLGFRLISVQRKLKDAGRFIFVDRVRKNPAFLQYYPGSLAYVERALRELPEFAALRTLLSRLVPGYPTGS